MNAQIVKGGPALALTLSPSTCSGTGLTEGQWCEATVSSNAVVPPIWDGPNGAPAVGPGIPAVGATSVDGSAELSQPTAGQFTLAHTVPCNSEQSSKLFMFTGGQLLESQEFDLVDTATPPPAPIPVPTLTATPSLVDGVPSIILTGF